MGKAKFAWDMMLPHGIRKQIIDAAVQGTKGKRVYNYPVTLIAVSANSQVAVFRQDILDPEEIPVCLTFADKIDPPIHVFLADLIGDPEDLLKAEIDQNGGLQWLP